MRTRKWIGILALFGVLLHAGAVVRHNAAMTGAIFQYQALVTSLAEICHGSGMASTVPPSDLPYVPRPSDAQSGCPICSGVGSAIALAAPAAASIPLPQPVAIAFNPYGQRLCEAGYAVCPPARGPPAVA
jgi:hypothetical protein